MDEHDKICIASFGHIITSQLLIILMQYGFIMTVIKNKTVNSEAWSAISAEIFIRCNIYWLIELPIYLGLIFEIMQN